MTLVKAGPILLSGPNQLTESVKDFVSLDQPTNIYIIGGEAVLHDSIQTELQSVAPKAQIQRFGGQDRFDTLSQILYQFYPEPTQLYLTNGYDFADALSGSALAAQNNGSILLIDPKAGDLPPAILNYLITLRINGVTPQVNALGGTVAVPDWLVTRVNECLRIENTDPSPTTPVNSPMIYAPMGDSLTTGLFATTVADSYVNQLATLISNSGKPIIVKNHGVSGTSIATGIEKTNAVNADYPDVVTIEYGTNDAGTKVNTDLTSFRTSLNTIIATLQAGRKPPLIVLLTTWNKWGNGDPFDKVIKDVGTQRGLIVVDLKPIYAISKNIGPAGTICVGGTRDNWHPNNEGHLAIAQAIFNAINSVLKP